MPAFLSPLFLLGALAAAVPVILHFLKREPESRVRFAAVRLLKQGPVEHDRHRRLREILLLVLRVTALFLLAAAFARPFFASTATARTTATVIAFDRSLSIAAPGQLDRAKALARDIVQRGPSGERIGVVTFADSARVESPLLADRGAAVAAIGSVSADSGAGRYRAGLQAAAELLKDGGGKIVVVTDLQASGWDVGDRLALPASIQVEVADVGAPPPNVAVTAVRVAGDRLVATVRNSGDRREVRISVSDGTGERGQATVTSSMAAGQLADVELPKPGGDTAIVEVNDTNGLQADNRRFVVFRGSGHGAVLVVTDTGDLAREAFYIKQALAAGGRRGAAPSIEGVGAPGLTRWDARRLAQYSSIILTSTRGLERQGRDLIAGYIAAGGGVLVPVSDRIDGEVLADALALRGLQVASGRGQSEARALTPMDPRHPVFQAFGGQVSSLSLAAFSRTAGIRGDACQPLARFTTGDTAILDCQSGEGRALILAFDLDNEGNDLPRRAAFLPFLHEAVGYLSASSAARSEYIVGEQPPGVPRTPGLVPRADSGERSGGWVAVNVDPRESDPARLTASEFQAAIGKLRDVSDGGSDRRGSSDQEEQQHLWQYALAAVILVLLAESLVAARA
ncbi:MAG TPA: BatA domain-containing protein [Vicinamibacterales bacterium]|jgi:hypothetical protein|nr:BatA domain-containing protein [Vicinamibacterales bacterium]